MLGLLGRVSGIRFQLQQQAKEAKSKPHPGANRKMEMTVRGHK